MKKTLFLFCVITINYFAAAQLRDTAGYKPPETWKRYGLGLRLGVGVTKRFSTEIGVVLQRYLYPAMHGFMVPAFYSSFEWLPAYGKQSTVYGVKAGAEIVNTGGAGAFEVRYLSDGTTTDLVFTPKYGIGVGFVNLYYGYNISTNKRPFPNIGRHQFSLIINSNLLHHKYPAK